MAIRGETLGEAFVRVHADTSLMHRELQAAAAGAGRDAGDNFGTEFFERVQASIRGKSNRLFEDFFTTGNIEPFIRQFKDVDAAIADIQIRMQDLHETGLEFGRGGALDQLGEALDRAFEARHANEAEALARELTKVAEAQGKISPSRDIDSMTRYAAALTKADHELESYARNLTRTAEAQGKWSPSRATVDVERYAASLTRAAQSAGDFNRAIRKVGDDNSETLNFLQRFRRDTEGLGLTIGRLFGRGSRNNFLNFFGSVITNAIDVTSAALGGLVTVIENIPKAFRAVQDTIGNVISGLGQFVNAIADADGAGAKFAAAGGQILGGLEAAAGPAGAALSALVVAAVAATAVLGGLGFALGALGEALAVVTAAASALAGAVTVAAGTLGVALAGAIGPMVPLVGALAAGVTTLIIAFTHMSDATKKAFEPLGKRFKEIGTAISDVFFKDAPKWVDTLTRLLTDFAGPTMTKVAGGIRNAVTQILADFDAGPVRTALNKWGDSFGPIAEKMTLAFGRGFEGLLLFFTPLIPAAEKLADKILQIANNFSAWAASAKGQNSITAFFDTAVGLADQLFGIVKDLSVALADVLGFAAASEGKAFLTWLGDMVTGFKNFVQSTEGKNTLATWFQEARTFGENLTTALGKVFDALSKLNTPQAQEFANKLVIAFGRLADIIGALSPLFDGVGRAIEVMLGLVSKVAGVMLIQVGEMASTFAALFHVLGHAPGMDWATKLGDDLDRVGDSAYAAGQLLVGLPDQVNIDFAADDSKLRTTVVDSKTMISTVDKDHVTHFLGSAEGLEAAAAQANTGINLVDTDHHTNFDGKIDALEKAADAAEGSVKAVPPEWVTKLLGDPSGLNTALSAAGFAVGTFKDENGVVHTTFEGETNALALATATATEQVNAVPPDWTTTFTGEGSSLAGTVAAANGAINSVLPTKNTDFTGEDVSLAREAAAAQAAIVAVPPLHITDFTGKLEALEAAAGGANAVITAVAPTHLTDFTGKIAQLEAQAAGGTAAINAVPDLNNTDFTGKIAQLEAQAAAGTVAINRVPDENLTTFNGNQNPLSGAAGAANSAINGVQDSNTTTFYGDVSPLLANIRRARAEIASLMAFNSQALGNADLGQRAAGAIVGMAKGGIAGAMAGTILRGPQVVLAGEAGPEAIVPLNRRLSQVDPSVRALSAIAQGLGGFGNIEEGAIVVNSNFANPHLVAEAVLDRLVLTLNG